MFHPFNLLSIYQIQWNLPYDGGGNDDDDDDSLCCFNDKGVVRLDRNKSKIGQIYKFSQWVEKKILKKWITVNHNKCFWQFQLILSDTFIKTEYVGYIRWINLFFQIYEI